MDHEGVQRGPGRLAGPAFFLPVACRRRALQKFPAILQSQPCLNVPALPRFRRSCGDAGAAFMLFPALHRRPSKRIPPRRRPNARGFARSSRPVRSSVVRAWRTNTLHRDRSAPLTSKEGFSVVAPIRMILPFSTNGRKASCWALLKRWISSTKTMVLSPYRRLFSACCITVRISLMPLVTAEKSINSDRVLLAIIRARVVFPTPGGPQKIIEEMRSSSIRRRSTFPFPRRCICPANSSNDLGRIRAASGWLSVLSKKSCCSMSLPPFSRVRMSGRKPGPVIFQDSESFSGTARYTSARTPPPVRAFRLPPPYRRCRRLPGPDQSGNPLF